MVANTYTRFQVGGRQYRVRTALGGDSKQTSTNRQASTNGERTAGEKAGCMLVMVPQQLHKFIVGARGSTLEQIHEKTHARVVVPPERSKSSAIKVEGLEGERDAAQRMILEIADRNMSKVPYTHFLSLPLQDHDVQRKVEEFQREAARDYLSSADGTGFVSPGSLHITAGMLRLLTPAAVAEAAALLKSLDTEVRKVLDEGPLAVKVGGLATMEPDPARARVIYAHVADVSEGSGRLRQVCELVRGRFDAAGYIDDRRELKLHVTLARAAAGRGGARVDARRLLQERGELELGTCRVEQIQVARRGKRAAGGAYTSDGAIQLP